MRTTQWVHPAAPSWSWGTWAAAVVAEHIGPDSIINAVKAGDRVFILVRTAILAEMARDTLEGDMGWTVKAAEPDALGYVLLTVEA